MIPILNKPADDEMFSTWMDYVMQLNGAENTLGKRNFLTAVFGVYPFVSKMKDYGRLQYFPGAETLCRIEENDPVFPKLEEILTKHTDLYAMMPFRSKGETAKRMEYCLHGDEKISGIYGRYQNGKGFKICPECTKEDEREYGRQIIHVQHQLCIDVCWKHHCILQYKDSGIPVKEEATDKDIEKAEFMHSLYEEPIYFHFWMLRPIIMHKFSRKGVSSKKLFKYIAREGYISQEQGQNSLLYHNTASASDDFCSGYIGAAVMLFHARKTFRNAVTLWRPGLEYTAGEFKKISSSGMLIRFKCRKCGYVFHMNPVAAQYGAPCPKCAGNMSKIEAYQRFADRLEDGDYDIYEEKQRLHIVHKQCGKDQVGVFVNHVWNHQGCLTCGSQINNQQNSYKDPLIKDRTGEEKLNKRGQSMRIKEYHKHTNIDVEFSNGTVIYGTTYDRFKNGEIFKPNYNKRKKAKH